jgi:hypothetical protein
VELGCYVLKSGALGSYNPYIHRYSRAALRGMIQVCSTLVSVHTAAEHSSHRDITCTIHPFALPPAFQPGPARRFCVSQLPPVLALWVSRRQVFAGKTRGNVAMPAALDARDAATEMAQSTIVHGFADLAIVQR